MLYIIAVCPDEQGCLAWRTEGSDTAAALITYLGLRTLEAGIDIMSVSSPDAYGEYKPYRFVKTEKEFVERILRKVDSETLDEET